MVQGFHQVDRVDTQARVAVELGGFRVARFSQHVPVQSFPFLFHHHHQLDSLPSHLTSLGWLLPLFVFRLEDILRASDGSGKEVSPKI